MYLKPNENTVQAYWKRKLIACTKYKISINIFFFGIHPLAGLHIILHVTAKYKKYRLINNLR